MLRSKSLLAVLFLLSAVGAAHAQSGDGSEPQFLAISIFVGFVLFSLFITYLAAKRTSSAQEFYAAGSGLTGFQNGLAIAGDWMSAATFLGMSGLVFIFGVDGIVSDFPSRVAALIRSRTP